MVKDQNVVVGRVQQAKVPGPRCTRALLSQVAELETALKDFAMPMDSCISTLDQICKQFNLHLMSTNW